MRHIGVGFVAALLLVVCGAGCNEILNNVAFDNSKGDSGAPAPRPRNAPTSLSFRDRDPAEGKIDGIVTIGRPSMGTTFARTICIGGHRRRKGAN